MRQREGRSAQSKAVLTSAGVMMVLVMTIVTAMVVSISVMVVLKIVTVGMQCAH